MINVALCVLCWILVIHFWHEFAETLPSGLEVLGLGSNIGDFAMLYPSQNIRAGSSSACWAEHGQTLLQFRPSRTSLLQE